jgi:AraC-like DNA-binding protein
MTARTSIAFFQWSLLAWHPDKIVAKSKTLVAILISGCLFSSLISLWHKTLERARCVDCVTGMELNGKSTIKAPTAFYRRDQDFLRLLDHIIKQQYSNRNLDVHELSARMAISERQLQRKSKSLLGSTPSEYLRSFRLRKSLLLLNKGITIGEAARIVGFSSQSYFASCFKAQFGCTPTEYQYRVKQKSRKTASQIIG